MSQKKKKEGFADHIKEKFIPRFPEKESSLSLIIPVYNCAERIRFTLESVQRQKYPFLEVIIVDAGSTDRTLEIISSFPVLISRIYSVAEYDIPNMLNRGISLASGRYIAFLFAGSFYLSDYCYATFAKQAAIDGFPDLLYCGSIQREIKREPRTIYRPFTTATFQKGHSPASLAACWFETDLFEKIGKFKPEYSVRAGFDFLCRVACAKNVTVSSIEKILVDFDYGLFTYGKAVRLASETWSIIRSHFGLKKSFVWFLTINHWMILKWIWRGMKQYLFKS